MDASKEGRYWLKFFLEAGIPHNIGADYAVKFIDHRIQKSILEDLSRDVLLEMGIKAMGDVIAILKHAKRVSLEVDRQTMRKSKKHHVIDDDVCMDDVPMDDDDDITVEEQVAPKRIRSAAKEKPKKKTIVVKPTTTIVATKTKVVKKPAAAKPKAIHHHDDDDDDDDDVTMMKRISAIRQETMTSPAQKSVFTRLGSDVTTTSSTQQQPDGSDVFRRLGDQPSVTSTTCDDVTMMDVDDDDVTSSADVASPPKVRKSEKRRVGSGSHGILSRLGEATIEVSCSGGRGNPKRVISARGGGGEPVIIRKPVRRSDPPPLAAVVSSSSDHAPKRYTSMHSDVMEQEAGSAKKRVGGGGGHAGSGSGVLRLKKKRMSAPSSIGRAQNVFNRLGGGGSTALRKATATPSGGKVTKMAAGKRVSMATMDQIVTSSTHSSVMSRLGAKTTLSMPSSSMMMTKKSKSMTNLAEKSRISKLLLSSGGRVRIKRSSMMTSQSSLSTSAGVLKRGGSGGGGSVFDRLGGR